MPSVPTLPRGVRAPRGRATPSLLPGPLWGRGAARNILGKPSTGCSRGGRRAGCRPALPQSWPCCALLLCAAPGVRQFRDRVPQPAGTAGREPEPPGTGPTQAAGGLVALGGREGTSWGQDLSLQGPASWSWRRRSGERGRAGSWAGLLTGYVALCHHTAPLSHCTAPLLRTRLLHGWQCPGPVLSPGGRRGRAGRLR